MLQRPDVFSAAHASTIGSGIAPAAGSARAPSAFRVRRGSALLETDHSRAVPPPELEIGEHGMPISQELAGMLRLKKRDEERDEEREVFTLAPEVDFNVSEHDHRYMTMSVKALLLEVGQRALGEGPADAVPPLNPGVDAEARRLGDMRYALHHQPGREHDTKLLHNAGRALYNFWDALRRLRFEMFANRPDLAPVIGPWIAGLVRTAVEQALQIPLGEDGEAQYNPPLYWPIEAAVCRPLADYLPELESRMRAWANAALQRELDRFFVQREQRRRPPGAARASRALPALPGSDETAGAAVRFTLPPEVNHNVPVHDRHYMSEPLEDLLIEVGWRALGLGPPDAVPPENPAELAETRRLGDIRFAVGFQPGRERDGKLLQSAGRALYGFRFDLRALVGKMRTRRPDLEPVIDAWAGELIKAAVQKALQIPLGDDGEAQYDPSLYWPIDAAVQRPIEDFLPDLESRLAAWEQARLKQAHDRFFARISRSESPDIPIRNGVVGARKSLIDGAALSTLLRGNIVFVCTKDELAANLQTIPAGRIWPAGYSGMGTRDHPLAPRYVIAYPYRASGTTIRKVVWRGEHGVDETVFVALIDGVHSYLFDGATHWTATGAKTSPALEAIRAEDWRLFLAERWNDRNVARS